MGRRLTMPDDDTQLITVGQVKHIDVSPDDIITAAEERETKASQAIADNVVPKLDEDVRKLIIDGFRYV